MEVWECDLEDVQRLSIYNRGVRYLLSVIDVFSKYLHVVHLKSKAGPLRDVSIHVRYKGPRNSKRVRRRPVWVHTDRGKEFLNKSFQDMLKREGTDFHVCRNPESNVLL